MDQELADLLIVLRKRDALAIGGALYLQMLVGDLIHALIESGALQKGDVMTRISGMLRVVSDNDASQTPIEREINEKARSSLERLLADVAAMRPLPASG